MEKYHHFREEKVLLTCLVTKSLFEASLALIRNTLSPDFLGFSCVSGGKIAWIDAPSELAGSYSDFLPKED